MSTSVTLYRQYNVVRQKWEVHTEAQVFNPPSTVSVYGTQIHTAPTGD